MLKSEQFEVHKNQRYFVQNFVKSFLTKDQNQKEFQKRSVYD